MESLIIHILGISVERKRSRTELGSIDLDGLLTRINALAIFGVLKSVRVWWDTLQLVADDQALHRGQETHLAMPICSLDLVRIADLKWDGPDDVVIDVSHTGWTISA